MEATKQQIEIIRHSLGVGDDGWDRSYRNYYCDAVDAPDLLEMVEAGWMKLGRTINEGEDRYFIVTKEGIQEHERQRVRKPKLTKSQRVYRLFMSLDTGRSFHHFLINPFYADARRRA